jgi:hypothetical protein
MAEQQSVKCLIAGTARNIASVWKNTAKSLDRIFQSVDDYCCVITESNSQDGTLATLQEWATADSRRHILTLGHLNEPIRTKRIAAGRNAYMDFFEKNGYFDKFDFMIVVDLDSSLNIEDTFKEQLYSCFKRDDWDGIGTNRDGHYYDVWALRSTPLGCTFDCWEMVDNHTGFYKGQLLTTYNDRFNVFVGRFQKQIPRHVDWIQCDSAFGCMALYKVRSVRNRRYNGEKTCEHISFHSGLRMFINPAFISG